MSVSPPPPNKFIFNKTKKNKQKQFMEILLPDILYSTEFRELVREVWLCNVFTEEETFYKAKNDPE